MYSSIKSEANSGSYSDDIPLRDSWSRWIVFSIPMRSDPPDHFPWAFPEQEKLFCFFPNFYGLQPDRKEDYFVVIVGFQLYLPVE